MPPGLSDILDAAGGGADAGQPAATRRVIEIDGTAIPQELDGLFESVLVVDRLRMPDSFVLIARDPDHDILEKAGVKIAAKVKISTTKPGGEEPAPLFFGEVTSIEAEYDALGKRAVVRGYDLLHRLSAGRKTKVFKNVTYADVAEEIADAAGLDADVDPSSGTLDHVIQANTSDLDFLYQLAARVGYDVGVDEEKLVFKKAGGGSGGGSGGPGGLPGAGALGALAGLGGGESTDLKYSRDLVEFRARMSAVAQVQKVNVRGWDVKTKEAVIGEAEAETTSAKISMSAAELAGAVGGEALVVVDRPVNDQSAADDLAKAIAEQVASSAFEATAVAVGNPSLKAGQSVNITDVDPALGGKWVITTARHEFGSGLPYRTHLEFSGRQDRSLHGLVAGGLSAPSSRSTIPGIVIGIVTDNDDPENLGRVKVKFPWLADDAESWWARVASIGAGMRSGGRGHGIVWIPEVDEEVIVAFEHGDVAHPIVIGSVWNGKAKPPMVSGLFDDGKVKKTAIISRDGHGIIFHDNDESPGMVIGTEGGATIGLDDKGQKITITVDKQITIETQGDLKLKAAKSVSIEAGTTLEMKSSANMTIKGAKVAIN